MQEFWESVRGWSEEKEQAYYDDWALRLITCPRSSCRRQRECAVEEHEARCLGLKAIPIRQDEREMHLLLMRAMLQQIVDDGDREDQESVAAEKTWRDEKKTARQKLAWERAKAAVNGKRR